MFGRYVLFAQNAEEPNHRVPREPKLNAQFRRARLGLNAFLVAGHDFLREDLDKANLLIRFHADRDWTVGIRPYRHPAGRFDPWLSCQRRRCAGQ